MKYLSQFKQVFNKKPSEDEEKKMKYRILVLDDEEDICLLLTAILRRLGHEVLCSHSLAEGKSDFVSFEPDLMFMDINLPDGNGLEEAPAFQKLDQRVRIIMISAYDFPAEINQSAKLKLTFLHKPFNKEKILQVIQTVN
jgi:two-component SAPR family response regulator